MKSIKSSIKKKINKSWRQNLKHTLSLIESEEEAEYFDDKITKYDVKNILYFDDHGWSYTRIINKNNYFKN